jgi:hypothetical protein
MKHLFHRDEDKESSQGGWFENTQLCPSQAIFLCVVKANGRKSRLRDERAWFLSRMERRAKPETEQLLTRWGKRCVLLSSLA